jgi:MFS family permease
MFVFGCITIAQGFVKSYSGLLATRFFLGLAEASVFPGCFLPHCHVRLHLSFQRYTILSFSIRWYKRSEAQKRFTFFFGSTSLAGAFGGLLAYAISKLEGKAGLASWRWVFIIGASVFPPRWVSCVELTS